MAYVNAINATWTVPICPGRLLAAMVNSEYTHDSHASRHGKLDSILRRHHRLSFAVRPGDEVRAYDRYVLLGNIEKFIHLVGGEFGWFRKKKSARVLCVAAEENVDSPGGIIAMNCFNSAVMHIRFQTCL